MIATCRCGQKNRLPRTDQLAESMRAGKTVRVRCGKCHRELSIEELARAVPEPPPSRTFVDGLDDEDDDGEEDHD